MTSHSLGRVGRGLSGLAFLSLGLQCLLTRSPVPGLDVALALCGGAWVMAAAVAQRGRRAALVGRSVDAADPAPAARLA